MTFQHTLWCIVVVTLAGCTLANVGNSDRRNESALCTSGTLTVQVAGVEEASIRIESTATHANQFEGTVSNAISSFTLCANQYEIHAADVSGYVAPDSQTINIVTEQIT